MPPLSLEDRVAALEQKVSELAKIKSPQAGRKDWRKLIGIFTDKPEMQQLLTDAMKLREEDRQKTRPKEREAKLKAIRAAAKQGFDELDQGKGIVLKGKKAIDQFMKEIEIEVITRKSKKAT